MDGWMLSLRRPHLMVFNSEWQGPPKCSLLPGRRQAVDALEAWKRINEIQLLELKPGYSRVLAGGAAAALLALPHNKHMTSPHSYERSISFAAVLGSFESDKKTTYAMDCNRLQRERKDFFNYHKRLKSFLRVKNCGTAVLIPG